MARSTSFSALSAAAFTLVSGCAAIDPHNVIGRQLGGGFGTPVEVVPSPPATKLDAASRDRAFEFVWNTINDRYYDPKLHGVDWISVGERYRPQALAAPDDEAFWETLDRMTGELRDAHTRVESPRRVELRRRDESISLGFSFVPIEGKLAVTGVSGDSDAWWAGVRPGMTIATIGGEPAMAAYRKLLEGTRFDSTERSRHQRALRNLLAGAEGTSVEFTFERADGTPIVAKVSRRKASTRFSAMHRVLPSGMGYIRFSGWTLGALPRFDEALRELSKAPGLVIDLRGNPGGSMHVVNEILERFFDQPTKLGHVLTRTGQPVSMLFGAVELIKLDPVTRGNANAYKGPVTILVNAGSASASELFSAAMQATGRATVVGEPTCGCLLGYLGYARVPGGADLAYSEVGFVTVNGKRVEGEGVAPDVVVPLTLEDLRAGRDRSLEAAQQVLARSVSKANATAKAP